MGSSSAGSLKITMVTTSYPRWPGDHAGHFVASLASSIAEEGHAVSVIAPHDRGAAESESDAGVTVSRVRYGRDSMERTAYGSGIVPNLKADPRAWIGVPGLRRALSRATLQQAAESDIIHAHWAPTVLLAGLSRAKVPVVLTLHGTDATLAGKSRPWRQALVRALKQVDGVITVSREQADLLAEENLWRGPLAVIPAGVPVELFERPRSTREEGHPFTFVFVGRLIETKGVIDLIEAFTLLDRRRAGSARLVLIGAGPLESKLRERVAARRLVGEVSFLGHLPHDETLSKVAEADALVLPSYGEGSPLSVVEAMATGTPVIGTRVGAIPSILGADGLVVDVGDVGELASAMGSWTADPDLAAAAGTAGRIRLARSHAWPGLAAHTVDFYRETLEASARGSAPAEVDL